MAKGSGWMRWPAGLLRGGPDSCRPRPPVQTTGWPKDTGRAAGLAGADGDRAGSAGFEAAQDPDLAAAQRRLRLVSWLPWVGIWM